MNDTKELLQKIAALRLRLDQAQGMAQEATRAADALVDGSTDPAAALENKVKRGGWHNALLEGALRGVEGPERPTLPHRLVPRAARLVQRARDLLQELKALADDPILRQNEQDPLIELHRGSASVIDGVLRTVQSFPPSPTAQLRHCEGLESMLDVVEDRLAIVKAGMRQRSEVSGRMDRLADALRRIAAGQTVSVQAVEQIAGEVYEEARQGRPLRFHPLPTDDAARAAAAHGLTVAHVFARLVQDDADWRGREREGLVAALVHDVGMARLPQEIIAQQGPLTEEQRRLVERHPLAGAQTLLKFWPGGAWAIDAAADHHERSDGTGYPKGKREIQLSEEVKLLAVCDVYAALASARPWRAAHEPRTALTDTLLLADGGALDKRHAERLLRLAYYPTGTAVELDDGSVALVVAPQTGSQALLHPSKPVVTIVREAFGQAPSAPRFIDLAVQRDRTIVRSLDPNDRRHALGRIYPELI